MTAAGTTVVDVDIREVGPRDGLQLEAPLPTTAKIEMLEALVATGVRRIEATGFVSPRAVPGLADADAVAATLHRWPEVRWSALVPNLRGAERALGAGIRDVEYVVSASDSHSLANTGRRTADALAEVRAVAELVHAAGGRLEVIVATAWDCPFEGRTPTATVVRLAAGAVAAGADEICLGDTIGTVAPGRVDRLLAAMRAALPGVALAAHFHNTRGTGIASAWAAIQAGVTRLDASAGGIGGCPFAPGASGNIATEELVYLAHESGLSTTLDAERTLDAARTVERLVGHPLESNLLRAGGALRPRGAQR